MREYSVPFSETAVTAEVDLFEIAPADDKKLEVTGLHIGQSTEFGDLASELIPYRVIRGFTTSGSGGSAVTPTPLDENDAVAGFTAEVCNTTLAKEGTTQDLHADCFNIMAGEKLWIPDGFWTITQAKTRLVVRITNVPADSITFSGTLYVREG